MAFREARIAAGLSVEEVKRKLGVSDAAIYNWETGENLPKPRRLQQIANLYNTTVDKLLSESGSE